MVVHLFKAEDYEDYEYEYDTGEKNENGDPIMDYDYEEYSVVLFYCDREGSEYSDEYTHDSEEATCDECLDKFALVSLGNLP